MGSDAIDIERHIESLDLDDGVVTRATTGGAAAAGALTGGFIGLAGGPLGAAIGAVGGALVGAATERVMHSDDHQAEPVHDGLFLRTIGGTEVDPDARH